jgi:hypothetical protein
MLGSLWWALIIFGFLFVRMLAVLGFPNNKPNRRLLAEGKALARVELLGGDESWEIWGTNLGIR